MESLDLLRDEKIPNGDCFSTEHSGRKISTRCRTALAELHSVRAEQGYGTLSRSSSAGTASCPALLLAPGSCREHADYTALAWARSEVAVRQLLIDHRLSRSRAIHVVIKCPFPQLPSLLWSNLGDHWRSRSAECRLVGTVSVMLSVVRARSSSWPHDRHVSYAAQSEKSDCRIRRLVE